jgi:hypothetical protein
VNGGVCFCIVWLWSSFFCIAVNFSSGSSYQLQSSVSLKSPLSDKVSKCFSHVNFLNFIVFISIFNMKIPLCLLDLFLDELYNDQFCRLLTLPKLMAIHLLPFILMVSSLEQALQKQLLKFGMSKVRYTCHYQNCCVYCFFRVQHVEARCAQNRTFVCWFN